MSDEGHRDEHPDAETLERLLADLERGAELAGGSAGAEAPDRRAYVELLGLVGASVEPLAPPPELKARILAGVATAPAAPPALTARAAPPPVARARRWPLPLAATLAIALAGVSGYQAAELAEQRATIETLSERLEQVEARTPAVAALRDRLAEMQAQMRMITARGVEICALRPMVPAARQANSRGVLYVSADHQHWYLTIEDLMPCSEGRSYQLWFVPEGGEPVSAGTFDVVEGVRVELSSSTMPAATRAITVTLEPAGGSPEPTGPAVLHGDEVMAVL